MPPSEAHVREQEVRRTKVADLWLRCVPVSVIAQRCGVDRRTISSDLNELRKEWKESRPKKFEERALDELARLELTYWDAWDRSCRHAEKTVMKTVPGKAKENGGEPEPEFKEGQFVSEGQSGNPAFLAGILSCINRRIQLMGLDAPNAQLVA